jgi:NAD(P)H-hydrate epimerase
MFRTKSGQKIPAVTEDQMREVDRIAVEEFGLGILQMMENAGRSLALNVIEMLGSSSGEVVILAGSGGNGGGGICCARHLHNRGFMVQVLLDRDPKEMRGPALTKLQPLEMAGLGVTKPGDAQKGLKEAAIVVDALIGYSLRVAPEGRTA